MLSEPPLMKVDIQSGYNENLSVVKHATSIHYVGTNAMISHRFTRYFEQVSENKSLLQVFNGIQSSSLLLPAIILIDIPVTLDELKRTFGNICNTHPEKILICCNAAHFQGKELEQAKNLDIIEDVFDFDNDSISMEKRILFLVKVFGQQRSCHPVTVRLDKTGKIPILLKRSVDCLVAGILLLLLAPIMALIAFAIWLESGGPVIYSQPRVGRGYRVFRFFKFRTMVQDADKQIEQLSSKNLYVGNERGPKFFKMQNDPRITRTGGFLRNTSLDELPQLFNVLRGDMSIVGNRPLPLYEAETLTSNECVERFCAPAGITGLWQVTKRGRPEMTVEERVKLDIEYARGLSPSLDLKILMATPKALFQKSNV
jgi:lipopolysaccharide/colanic/teichoic acid biosynthesis glycosyltransferase